MSALTTRPLALAVLGCGYVGAAVCRQATAAGQRVVGVVRTEASRTRLIAEGITAVRADIVAGELANVAGPFDQVVYAVSAGGGGLSGYRAAYVDGLRAALGWAASVGARSFVFTSSTGVYRGSGDVDERAFVGGSPTADVLVEGERLVLESGFATRVVLRLGGLYGPGRHYLYVQIASGQRRVAGPVSHRINYVHRDDAAAAVLAAAFAPPGAYTFNVTDGQPVVKADLARWICARLQVGSPIFDDPAGGEPQPGSREAPPDRRILADEIRRQLQWQPQFADVYAGLAADFG